MEGIDVDIDPQTAAKSPFIAGVFGALVALRGVPGQGWPERIANVASGTLMAGFFAPAVSEYFGLETAEMRSAIAFAIGLFGLNIMAVILASLKTINLADFIPWKKRGE